MMLQYFVWNSLLAILFHSSISETKSLKIEIESITACPGNEKMRYPIRDIQFSRINETHSALNYKITYSDDIGDNLWSGMVLQRWSNGGWVGVTSISQKNPCKLGLKVFPEGWISFAKALGVEHPEKCPIPKGNYTLKNYLIPVQAIKVPMWAGRFRFRVEWTESKNSKDSLYCQEIGFNSVEQF